MNAWGGLLPAIAGHYDRFLTAIFDNVGQQRRSLTY
jgi:hypothetical protein